MQNRSKQGTVFYGSKPHAFDFGHQVSFLTAGEECRKITSIPLNLPYEHVSRIKTRARKTVTIGFK